MAAWVGVSMPLRAYLSMTIAQRMDDTVMHSRAWIQRARAAWPHNDDALTLTTDPVLSWALACLSFGAGVGVLNLSLVMMSL